MIHFFQLRFCRLNIRPTYCRLHYIWNNDKMLLHHLMISIFVLVSLLLFIRLSPKSVQKEDGGKIARWFVLTKNVIAALISVQHQIYLYNQFRYFIITVSFEFLYKVLGLGLLNGPPHLNSLFKFVPLLLVKNPVRHLM